MLLLTLLASCCSFYEINQKSQVINLVIENLQKRKIIDNKQLYIFAQYPYLNQDSIDLSKYTFLRPENHLSYFLHYSSGNIIRITGIDYNHDGVINGITFDIWSNNYHYTEYYKILFYDCNFNINKIYSGGSSPFG
jgi:hypothetical protein